MADVNLQFLSTDICQIRGSGLKIAKGIMTPQLSVAFTAEMQVVLAGQAAFGGNNEGVRVEVGNIMDSRVSVSTDTARFPTHHFTHQQWNSRRVKQEFLLNVTIDFSYRLAPFVVIGIRLSLV